MHVLEAHLSAHTVGEGGTVKRGFPPPRHSQPPPSLNILQIALFPAETQQVHRREEGPQAMGCSHLGLDPSPECHL